MIDPGFARFARAACRACSLLVAVTGVAVLAGWVLDLDLLKSISDSYVAMKVNNALGFIAVGVALWLLTQRRDQVGRRIGSALAIFSFVLGAATFSEYAFGWDLGIDNLLVTEALAPDSANEAGTLAPGRMAFVSTICFMLSGIGCFALSDRKVPSSIAQICGVVVALVALVVALGYLYGVSAFRGLVHYTPMAVHTTTAFLATGVALCLATPHVGFMRAISANELGGVLARRTIPAVVVIPAVIGLLRVLGERAGLFPTELGVALFVAAVVVIMFAVTWVSAGRLNALDGERSRVLVEMARLNDEQRAFVAAASHELRTPLTSIMGYLEILRDEETGPLNETQRSTMTVVERNSRRLYGLVDSLMLLFRSERRENLKLTAFDAVKVAAQAVESAMPSAQAKGLTLTLDSAGPAEMRGYEDYIALAIDNLISNAIKFTPSGGRVEVSVASNDGRVRCRVTDTGIGISPEDQTRLFEKFFRASTATASRIQGTGLGLSITRSIAEAHGGSVVVSSSEGQGSTFELILPAKGADS